MKKFEYLYKRFVDNKHDTKKSNEIQEDLSKLGGEGWELVSFNFDVGLAILKREKREKQLLTEVEESYQGD